MAVTRSMTRARRKHDARLSAAAKHVQRLQRGVAFHEPRAKMTAQNLDAFRDWFRVQHALHGHPSAWTSSPAQFMAGQLRKNYFLNLYHQGSLDDHIAAIVPPMVELAMSARSGRGQQRRAARARAPKRR